MKFRDITAKVPKGAINLLTNKPIKGISKKKKTKKEYIEIISETPNLAVDAEYGGEALGIAGLITQLPPAIQLLLTNAVIKTSKATAGNSMFVLSNGFTIKITDEHSKYKKQHIIIKQGKKIILDKYV